MRKSVAKAGGFVSRHPVAVILVAGTVLRLLLSTLSVVYDVDYWALEVRNMQVGEGLYGIEGYFYSPVWGYILGIASFFQTFVLDIGETSVRVAEMLFTENIGGFFLSATVPSVAFAVSVKLPLIVCDIILACLVYRLVLMLSDERKAVTAMALTFFCPILFGVTSFIGMPDTVSAMFSVLTAILLMRDRPFIAGLTFSIAVWTKFFPAFLFFPFVFYIMAKNRGRLRSTSVQVLAAMAGFVLMTVVLYLPEAMEGSLAMCFQFITDRTEVSVGGSFMDSLAANTRLVSYVAILFVSFVSGYRLLGCDRGHLDRALLRSCFVAVLACMLYPPAPQYVVLLVPFLAMAIAMEDRRQMIAWAVLFVSSVFFLTPTNADMLLPLAAWTDLVDIGTVVDVFTAFRTELFGGFTVMDLHYAVGGAIQYLSFLLMVFFLWKSVKKGPEAPEGLRE